VVDLRKSSKNEKKMSCRENDTIFETIIETFRDKYDRDPSDTEMMDIFFGMPDQIDCED
jgi:hypothetical protein